MTATCAAWRRRARRITWTASASHYNEGIIRPHQTSGDPRDDYYTRYFWGMVNTYYNAFGGARPLCFTELGYVSPEGFGPLPGGFAWGQTPPSRSRRRGWTRRCSWRAAAAKCGW